MQPKHQSFPRDGLIGIDLVQFKVFINIEWTLLCTYNFGHENLMVKYKRESIPLDV